MNAEQEKNSSAPSATRNILFSSMKMALATFSSRILGLVREMVMAAVFGASGITDAFTIAYRVPNMLRDLFAEGAFSSAFVPVFTEAKLKDSQEARRLMWSLVVLLGGITTILSILIIIFAPEIVQLFTNDKFSGDMERLHLTASMVQIMAPFLVLVSLAALFMGVLNSLKIFFVPSFAPAFFNVMMIISMLTLPSWLQGRGYHPILSMAIGVIAGGLAQMLVQIPLVLKNKYGPIGGIKLFNEHTNKIIHRIGIGTIGIAATQINILITTILATSTVLGAVSWLTYAFRLFQFPVGILSVSVAGSNLVHFSDAWKRGDKETAIETLKSSYFLSLLTVVPAGALLFALAGESVHLIFERGRFDANDTLMTASALRFYTVGLVFYGLYKIFAPSFFTLDKPRTPVMVSITAIVFNIIFCVLLTPKYGFKVLALGTSLSMVINSGLQACFLRRMLGLKLSFFFNLRVVKVFVAGSLCYAVTWWLGAKFFPWDAVFLSKLLMFCLIGLGGSLSYALALLVMGEWGALKRVLRLR